MPVSETIDGETYDTQVTRLQKNQDWEEAARFSHEVERRIAHLIRAGAATDDDKRLRLQALLDLQVAYTVLERPKEQLRAAKEAHRARTQLSTPDRLDDHFSYTALAQAYAANEETEQAREMFLCAGASVSTRWQTEWLSVALDELAAFEKAAGNERTADVIVDLVKGLKRAANRVERRGQRESRQTKAEHQIDLGPPAPSRSEVE